MGNEKSEAVLSLNDWVTKPAPGFEVGKNLFWVDGINRWVHISDHDGMKKRFVIRFMVNAGRLEPNRRILPEFTVAHLTRFFFDRDELQIEKNNVHVPFITQYVKLFSWDPGVSEEDLFHRFATDPTFFVQ